MKQVYLYNLLHMYMSEEEKKAGWFILSWSDLTTMQVEQKRNW